MALAFLANMAMAVAPVIKDALDSCDISLQQLLLKFMAVADPRLTTSMSAFFILNSHGLSGSINTQTQPTTKIERSV